MRLWGFISVTYFMSEENKNSGIRRCLNAEEVFARQVSM